MSDEDVIARLGALVAQDSAAGDECLGAQLRDARAKIAQLQIALDHRTMIGQAVGILSERYGIDTATAFDALRRVSSQTNRKLFEIAQELATTGSSDGFDQRSPVR
jgi:hypothetical protein